MKPYPKIKATARPVAAMALTTALAMLILATGCSTMVKTEFKPDMQFSAYRTFAVLPYAGHSPAGDPGMALRLAEPAKEAGFANSHLLYARIIGSEYRGEYQLG